MRAVKVPSEPEALVALLGSLGLAFERIGLEAGPLSQWLLAGLEGAGLPVVLIETRHVKAALSAMTMKTDKHDARGIAQLMRLGWVKPVHVKTLLVLMLSERGIALRERRAGFRHSMVAVLLAANSFAKLGGSGTEAGSQRRRAYWAASPARASLTGEVMHPEQRGLPCVG